LPVEVKAAELLNLKPRRRKVPGGAAGLQNLSGVAEGFNKRGRLAIAHRFCLTFSILHILHILRKHNHRSPLFAKNVNEVLTRGPALSLLLLDRHQHGQRSPGSDPAAHVNHQLFTTSPSCHPQALELAPSPMSGLPETLSPHKRRVAFKSQIAPPLSMG